MRDDELDLPLPPTDDRPGDSWFPQPYEQRDSAVRFLTWHGRRRRWFLVAAICVLALCIALPIVMPSSVLFKPGPLSKPHAQILAGTVVSQRCASCHQQNALSPFSIFSFSGSATNQHHDTNQLDLCMECHRETIQPNLAAAAHNLPLSVRDELTNSLRLASKSASAFGQTRTWIPNAAVDQNNVQCSVCHREHHGKQADLRAMSNQQCQTCHSQRFDHFGNDHPDWQQWPYGRGGQISFDHSTHSAKHFPNWTGGGAEFDCGACHGQSQKPVGLSSIASGELMRSSSFEVSCANCHDESMRVQLDAGIELVALPMMPEDVANAVSGWPESATGFADGIVPPLTEILLRADPELAQMLREIPSSDLGRLNEGDPRTTLILSGVARGIQRLLDDVSRRGQVAIEERLRVAGFSTKSIGPLLSSLSPQMISSAKSAWKLGATNPTHPQASVGKTRFRLVATGQDDLLLPDGATSDPLVDDGLISDLESDDPLLDDPLLDDPLLDDPLLDDPLIDDPLSQDSLTDDPLAIGGDESTTPSGGADCPDCELSPQEQVRFGGWYRDDARLSLRYRAASHSNSVVKSLIELFSQLSETDPLKKRFFEQTSVKACIECHSSAGSFPSQWKALNLIGKRNEFTKFSHRPHLNISSLGDCQYCHQIKSTGSDESVNESLREISLTGFGENDRTRKDMSHDFRTMDRQSCAGCHTAKAAGDNCTTCHRYHIDW